VLGGGQVTWLGSGSGNTQETDELLAGPLAGGEVRSVDTVQRTRNTNGGNDPGTYLGFLVGSGNALAYNRWFCAATGPLGVCLGPTRQQLVRIAGARRVVIARGARAYALGGAGGGRLAVVSGDTVTVLAPNGARVARVTGEPTRRTALSRSRLAVERTFSLDLYAAATGRKTRSLPLGPAAALGLIGLNDRLALLSGQSGIVLVRLRDGKLVSLLLEDPIDPTLTEAGLFYAYNTPKARVKGHVVFEPTAALLRRF